MIANKPVPLFFAFPDGVFDYVCAECDALCCKGQGLGGSLKREMGFLLKQYPALAAAANSRQRDLIDISTPGGCCFFLRSDNLCQIETEHGRSKKPGICMVFPFNRFHRLGDTVLVSPHFMCPLRIHVPARPGEVAGTHAAIEATVVESQMLDPKYVDWYLKAPKLSHAQARTVLAREAGFRDVCTAALNRQRFIDVLTDHSENEKELTAFVRRAGRVMAWGTASRFDERDALDDVLLAIASSLRVEMLEFSAERILRLLALADRLVRRLFSLSVVPPKPQAIYTVIQHAMPVLRLLSHADDPPKVRRQRKSPPFGHPELVFAAFLVLRDISSIGVLNALDNGFKRLSSPADRTVLASHVAEQVLEATG